MPTLSEKRIMPKIAQKARYEIEPPIFEERLSKLPKVASVCRRRQDYASAVDVCATCRMAFASYYNRWGLTPHLADQRMTDRLEKGLTECFDVVGGVTDFADDQERQSVEKFRKNIGFQVELLSLLHKKGRKAVQDALTDNDPAHL